MATVADEETPLLAGETPPSVSNKQQKSPRTPLPWAQFSIILFLQLAEPLTSQVISPFTPELIRHLHVAKNEADVGFYVGMMQSLFFATQAITIFHWSRLSDHIGRKPVILSGLFGLSLSMYCFGLSKTFWGLVLSRSLNGALNGNVGIIKSLLAEITDPSNVSSAYSYVPIPWSLGGALGPAIGGALSRPAERFPKLFGNSQFLKEYPYFLPCAVPATFTVIAWLVAFVFLKETVVSPTPIRQFFRLQKNRPIEVPSDSPEVQCDKIEKPLPFRKLLTRRVFIASSNYALLALVDIAYRALQPLFFSTPIELGGLGLDPLVIGTIMSSYGVLNGVFQLVFFTRLNDTLGSRNMFILGITATFPCFLLFPAMNLLVRQYGMSPVVWLAIGMQTSISVLVGSCYGLIFIYVAASSPNKGSLGATNGLAQFSTSVVRAVGPVLTNSLYSLSIDEKHHYLNGRLVYVVTIVLSCIAFASSLTLPKQVWRNHSDR